jgi:hypothetical protein
VGRAENRVTRKADSDLEGNHEHDAPLIGAEFAEPFFTSSKP